MTRRDEHRPSAIQPEDYEFVGYEYLSGCDSQMILEWRKLIRAHMERTGGGYSGNCHVCGAHAIYTALFYHRKINSYVRTGLDCAEKVFNCDSSAFRKGVALEARRVKDQARAREVLDSAGLERAWEIFTDPSALACRALDILKDVVSRLVRYGTVSEKQIALLRSLVTQVDDHDAIEARRREEEERALPVPDFTGRATITGEVVSLKSTDWGLKMLVRHADGWKVYGSVPSAINPGRGDWVQFKATVKRSDRDPKFGFFKRPTNALVV